MTGMRWYVVHAYSGMEKAVERNLRERIEELAADLAAVGSGGAPRFNPDREDTLALLGTRVARLKLFRYYQTLLRQRALLGHPLQPRLVAEALLFEYRAMFAR